MANPFLARLLDTQQRGLQAERERQMRNDAFGNLGFLGQSLQRSFQPLAEMQQREDLQTQAEQARKSLQEQQQNFEQDQKAAELGLKFDRESKNFFREIPARYDPVSQKTEPARREVVNPTQIRADIEAGKARDLARFNTNQSINLFGKKLAIEDQRTIKRLGGRLTPEGLVEIPVRDDNGNILRDNDGKTMYSPPVSLEQAVQASELNKLKGETKVTEESKINLINAESDASIQRYKEKTGLDEKILARTYGGVVYEDPSGAIRVRVPKYVEGVPQMDGGKPVYEDMTFAELKKRDLEDAEFRQTRAREKALEPGREKDFQRDLEKQKEVQKDAKELIQARSEASINENKERLNNEEAAQIRKLGGTLTADGLVRVPKVMSDGNYATDREGDVEFVEMPLAAAMNQSEADRRRMILEAEEPILERRADNELERAKDLKKFDLEELRLHEKTIATDKTLQDALIKNLEKKAEATSKGQDLVEINRERRRIGYETLSKGINALIETDNNITVEQIKDLATGTGLSEEALTQMVYSANAQGTKTRIERKLLMAQNDLLTKEQRFDILNTVPVSKGGFKGSKLKFEDYERNARVIDHFVDRGIELTDEELESAGYKTKESKNLIKKLSKDTKHTKTLKDIATQVESILQSDPLDQPLDGSGMLTRDQRLKNIFEEINSDPAKKEALEARGYDYKWFKGNADRIARQIEKDEADIKLVKATALGKLSKDSEVKEGVREDIFRDRMKVLFTQYESSPEKLAIEEARLRRNLYGSTDGGPPFGGSTGVLTGSNTENNQSGSLGNQLRTGGGFVTKGEEEAKEEVPETITQPSVEQPVSQDRSVIRRDASTPPEAVREVLQDKRPMKEGVLSNALRVIDDILGGDSLNQKRAREIYNGVSGEMGGEAQMLNTLSGKNKEELAKILRDNAPKRGGEGYGKDTRIRIPDDTVDKIFEAVKEYDNFVQPVASIDT